MSWAEGVGEMPGWGHALRLLPSGCTWRTYRAGEKRRVAFARIITFRSRMCVLLRGGAFNQPPRCRIGALAGSSILQN